MSLIPRSVSFGVSRNLLVAKKQSPHIFFVGGLIGVVASAVMASRATLKLNETLDDIQKDMNDVKELKHSADTSEVEVVGVDRYPDGQYGKDLLYVYAKASWQVGRLYAPAIIVGGVGVVCLTGSHVQLTRRNAALMAGYAALQTAFEEYRERVRVALGEEKEQELYRGVETAELADEEGNKAIVKKVDPNKLSVYAKIFDEYSEFWKKDPEMNRLFLQCQQNFANNRLQARGHLFLNEVYEMLGLDHSKAGAVVGWVIGDAGDNYVDFGIFESFNTAFVNGWERSIVLDFNVDGVIYDKI